MKTALTFLLMMAVAAAAQDRTYGLSEPYFSELLHAHQLYRSNEFDRALSVYTNLLTAPIPCFHQWAIRRNIGDWRKEHGEYAAAIESYRAILDYASVHGPIETNHIRGYRYECHACCIRIAECFEAQGDLTNAIHYAALGLTYPAAQLCGLDRSPLERASNYLDRLQGEYRRSHEDL